MAAKTSTRVVLNRAALDEVTLGIADGLLAMADAVVATAHVPDDPIIGQGLVQTGGTVAYVNGRKVGGNASKPRAVAVRGQGILAAGGYGFPGHFAEFGTIHERARPFLTPALMATVPDAEGFIRAAVARRIGSAGQRASVSTAIKARASANA